jgi:hypothetical protein
MSITDSATIARIQREYVYQYREKNPEFAKAMDAALIATDARAIRLVRKAMGTQWQSAAWWLERKRPDEFALKSRVDLQLTFNKSEKMKPIDNEKLIEVVETNEIENHAE